MTEGFLKTLIKFIFDTNQFFIVSYVVTFKNIYKKYLNVPYPTDIEVPSICLEFFKYPHIFNYIDHKIITKKI